MKFMRRCAWVKVVGGFVSRLLSGRCVDLFPVFRVKIKVYGLPSLIYIASVICQYRRDCLRRVWNDMNISSLRLWLKCIMSRPSDFYTFRILVAESPEPAFLIRTSSS
jgi:hypothetical protein